MPTPNKKKLPKSLSKIKTVLIRVLPIQSGWQNFGIIYPVYQQSNRLPAQKERYLL